MARYFHREHDDQLATRSPGEFCILLPLLDIWDSSPQNTSEFPGLGDFTLACLSSVHFNYPWANQYRYDMRFGKNAFTLLPYEFSIFFQVVLCSVNSLGTFGSRARASQSALARDSVKVTFKQSPGSKNQAASVSKKKTKGCTPSSTKKIWLLTTNYQMTIKCHGSIKCDRTMGIYLTDNQPGTLDVPARGVVKSSGRPMA